MSSYQIEALNTPRCIAGEGPHWDAKTQSLYFIDGLTPELPIHRYDYVENKTYSAKLTGTVGNPHVFFIIPVENEPGHFVIPMENKIGVIEWDGKAPEAKLIRTIFTLEDGAIADAKVDKTGRLYFGTHFESYLIKELLANPAGKLFKYVKGEKLTAISDGIFISNGLTWNEDRNKFYFIDSAKKNVLEYDHDPVTGNISNERMLIDFTTGDNSQYFPDGMTIDKDGFIYVAMFEGCKIVKIDPKTGKIVLEIEIPVKQVTSVAFGGPNLDILYATTAAWEITDEKRPLPAGLVFKVTGVGVGLTMHKARV